MTLGALEWPKLALPPRRRAVATGQALALALIAALLILGRAGFVGSPISYVVVSGHSMEPTFHTGDVVVLRRTDTYHAGEVVGYKVPKGSTGAGLIVIHRIVGGGPRDGYLVKGDNKQARDPWRPHPSDVVGQKLLMVPKLGLWITYLRSPIGISLLAGLITMAVALGGSGGEKRSPETGTQPAASRLSGRLLWRRSPRTWRRSGSPERAPSSSGSAASSPSEGSGRRTRSSQGPQAGRRSAT